MSQRGVEFERPQNSGGEETVVEVERFTVAQIIWDQMWRKDRRTRNGQQGLCVNKIVDTEGKKHDISETWMEVSPEIPVGSDKWERACRRAFASIKGKTVEIIRSEKPLGNGMNVLVRILPKE